MLDFARRRVGRKQVHRLGGADACRARFERMWADHESIKAETEKDARQSISSAATTVNPSAAYSVGGTWPSSSGQISDNSDKLIVDAKDNC